jgi:hypothetical protein
MPDCKLPNIGDTIHYKMRLSDSPTDPNRILRGRVIKVHPKTYDAMACVEVKLLEDGYEEETELVILTQVVQILATESR